MQVSEHVGAGSEIGQLLVEDPDDAGGTRTPKNFVLTEKLPEKFAINGSYLMVSTAQTVYLMVIDTLFPCQVPLHFVFS